MRTDEKQNPGPYICLVEASEKVRFQHGDIDDEDNHDDNTDADEDGLINLTNDNEDDEREYRMSRVDLKIA